MMMVIKNKKKTVKIGFNMISQFNLLFQAMYNQSTLTSTSFCILRPCNMHKHNSIPVLLHSVLNDDDHFFLM